MTETAEGTCKHCGQYYGVAVKTHEMYCLSINSVVQPAAAIQHDSDAAAHGKCKCPLCVIDDELTAWV